MAALPLVVLLNHLLVAMEMLHATCVVTFTDMPSAKFVSKDIIESVACIQSHVAHPNLIFHNYGKNNFAGKCDSTVGSKTLLAISLLRVLWEERKSSICRVKVRIFQTQER